MKFILKDYLEYYNIPIQKLAKSVGVTRQTMAKLVNGETASIKFEDLEKICLALDCTPDDLFVFEEKDPDRSKVIIPNKKNIKSRGKYAYTNTPMFEYRNSEIYDAINSGLESIIESILNRKLKEKDDTK